MGRTAFPDLRPPRPVAREGPGVLPAVPRQPPPLPAGCPVWGRAAASPQHRHHRKRRICNFPFSAATAVWRRGSDLQPQGLPNPQRYGPLGGPAYGDLSIALQGGSGGGEPANCFESVHRRRRRGSPGARRHANPNGLRTDHRPRGRGRGPPGPLRQRRSGQRRRDPTERGHGFTSSIRAGGRRRADVAESGTSNSPIRCTAAAAGSISKDWWTSSRSSPPNWGPSSASHRGHRGLE